MGENTARTALLASLVTLMIFFPILYGCAPTGSPVVGGHRTATEELTGAGPGTVHETDVAGAAAMLDGDRSLQKRALIVDPSPRKAKEQRSKMHAEGCQLDRSGTKSAECAFGDPSSETTVVLFGDSHAMLWFPALNEIAKERNWRLVGLTKSACPPAEVHRYIRSLGREYSECDAWRERTLGRIMQQEHPRMVVVSMNSTYQVMRDGKRLGRRAGVRTLEEGYVSTLDKLRSTGAEVVAINDIPHPGKDIPKCVSRSRDHLQDCATPRDKALNYPQVNASAAAKAQGAHFIDPTPLLCLEKVCPAVVGDVLVYRNGAHLTPTYVRTLTPWLAKQLPEPTG